MNSLSRASERIFGFFLGENDRETRTHTHTPTNTLGATERASERSKNFSRTNELPYRARTHVRSLFCSGAAVYTHGKREERVSRFLSGASCCCRCCCCCRFRPLLSSAQPALLMLCMIGKRETDRRSTEESGGIKADRVLSDAATGSFALTLLGDLFKIKLEYFLSKDVTIYNFSHTTALL